MQQISYQDAIDNVLNTRQQLDESIADKDEINQIVRYSGRYVSSLQVLRNVAMGEARDLDPIYNELNLALQRHGKFLKKADLANKDSKHYSIIKEVSGGFKELVNSVNKTVVTSNDEERKEDKIEVAKKVGKNVKNIIKAPVVFTTRILANDLVSYVLLAPISLSLGCLSAIYSAVSPDKENPFTGKGIALSKGLTNVMEKINNKVQKL